MAVTSNAAIIFGAVDRATPVISKISRAFQTMDRDRRAALKRSAAAAAAFGGAMAAIAGKLAQVSLKQRGQTETALGDLRSVGIRDLAALENAATRFSNRWSGTTKSQFLTAAYDIKSGISSLSDEGVAEFTRLAGLTAKATKGTVEQMTDLFATGYGIYKKQFKNLDDIEFGKVFASGLAASVQAFKSNGPKMAAAIQNLGAAATNANVPFTEQLAILGLLQQTMKSGEVAGTAYRAFLDKAGKAGKELGLPFLDSNKRLKSTAEIIELLRKKYGDTIDDLEKQEMVKAFGGVDASKVVEELYSKTGLLRGHIRGLTKEVAEGAIATKMANDRNRGLAERAEVAAQQISNVAEAIGSTFSAGVKRALAWASPYIVKLQQFIKDHPRLTKMVLVGAAAFGVLAAALGGLTLAMTLFNFAALANPVTWIVLTVVAALAVLVAAGVALYAYWDDFLAWWKQYWAKWGDVIILALGAVATIFFGPVGAAAAAVALIFKYWDDITGWLSGAWDSVTQAWESIDLTETGMNILRSLWGGIKAVWADLQGWVTEKIDSLFSWLPDWAKAKLGLKVTAAGSAAPAASQGPAAAGPAPLLARNRVDGKILVEVKGPPGTRIREASQKGDAAVDIYAGQTLVYPV